MEMKPGSYFAYVGSRTTKERNARGIGLSVYAVTPGETAWTLVQVLDDLVNPSFLAFDRHQRALYAVHGDRSEISAFRIDPQTGRLTLINQASTEGKNPVHLCIDPGNRFITVANHITSTLALMPLGEDGSIGPVCDLVSLTGTLGPHRVEQPFPKPHQVLFDRAERFIAVPDKGLDRTFVFRIDTDAQKLVAVEGATAPAQENAGPRHLVFSPSNQFAYIVNELNSTITACRFDATTGALSPFQVVPSLPDSCVVNSRASEITITSDCRFLYASNRGYDSVSIYGVDPGNGRLSFVDCERIEGRTPRFITLSPDERHLFVANEDSDEIIACRIDPRSGKLMPCGTAARTGSPVCIVFRPRG
ncbi:lactonase family protein [Propionivibrio dicarboxylicus]|uniref:6-phosphogluconolactonase, cycloisomerase 2 family n=1 Tax=Propionivibrio dicarboxylicus TaxID=83767 RepID=A0A1G8J3H7_9RHOO|nr:lactonase family protein [Propionivibrio dicarboxylicus]SDI25764.1 6-phosphogluconolactonase, cycloisomerase 2 family [Propionivibrio dicarboxylicus]